MATEWLGYTNGLHCNPPVSQFNMRSSVYRVEKERLEGGSVRLTAILRNLNQTPFSVTITADAYNARPRDPYDDTAEAMWALRLLGFTFNR